jgi:hypothetical protein
MIEDKVYVSIIDESDLYTSGVSLQSLQTFYVVNCMLVVG